MKRSAPPILILMLAILAACRGSQPGFETATPPPSAIVGGMEIAPGEADSRRVHLWEKLTFAQDGTGHWSAKGRSICSVSLIGRRLLLAARHCLPATDTRARVFVEFLQPDGSSKKLAVIDWRRHPGADLAIAELEADAPKSAEILKLPARGKSYDFKTILALGYGRSDGHINNEGNSGLLRRVSLNVQSYDPETKLVRVNQRDGKGFCQGDSGGPGLINAGADSIMIGVASQTIYTEDAPDGNYDKCAVAGLYVHLPDFLDWIAKTSAELKTSKTPPPQLIGD